MKKNIPGHVAIIMDGNRRWARKKGMPAIHGHEYGVKALEKTIDHSLKIGLSHLTVYAFSTENWRRSKIEVNALMRILESYLRQHGPELNKKGVQVRIFGEISRFPKGVQKELNRVIKMTKNNQKLNLNLALNYGGRAEIVRSTREIVKKRISPDKITENTIGQQLYSAGQPDPDLVVRTGG
jgi:undecaprenyl diphosphate synthase